MVAVAAPLLSNLDNDQNTSISQSPSGIVSTSNAGEGDAERQPTQLANGLGGHHPTHVFTAVYSGVPVYEMMARGIGVMKRRSDGYLNATQILKVAGVDKVQRTKILEKDIVNGEGAFEKVQGGYGRYQGTWIPLDRAKEFAKEYGVLELLDPILNYSPAPFTQASPTLMNVDEDSIEAVNGGDNFNGAVPQKRTRESRSHTPARPESKRSKVDKVEVPREESANNDSNHQVPMDTEGDDSNVVTEQSPEKVLDQDNATKEEEGSSSEIVISAPQRGLRRATKYDESKAIADPLASESNRSVLMQIFMIDTEKDEAAEKSKSTPTRVTRSSTAGNEAQQQEELSSNSVVFPPELDLDTPIDEQNHTALHWAAALARLSLVRSLCEKGADMFRGNKAGETPLSRAVLVTNCHQSSCFPQLLELLSPSLRVVDDSFRSVLHHITLVAGVRGRAASSLYYLQTTMEYLARNSRELLLDLVDTQDVNGDTALNIAARVGSRSMVRLLVDAGADRFVPNKLGLRPCDFGLEEDLSISPGEEVLGTLRNENRPPSTSVNQPPDEIVGKIRSVVDDLQDRFCTELGEKQDVLNVQRDQLRTATRKLAGKRRELQTLRNRVTELEKAQQRVRNLEKALSEEDSYDWLSGTEMSGNKGLVLSMTPDAASVDPPLVQHEDAKEAEELIQLRRAAYWYHETTKVLGVRIDKINGASADMLVRCQKIIAICCKVPVGEIDGMIDQLLVALETDGKDLDMTRVAAFIHKQRESNSTSSS